MAARRVAAMLSKRVRAEMVTYPHGAWQQADRELRALIAVARAADLISVKSVAAVLADPPRARELRREVAQHIIALRKPLARLARASGRGRG
jgi:hypothetical protein